MDEIPISCSRFLIQLSLVVVVSIARYSTSRDDLAVDFCFLDD